MFIRKFFLSIGAVLLLATNAFSGSEDWNGTFTVQDKTGEARAVAHTPTGIQFLFFNVEKCLHLAKGAKINEMIIPEEVMLCTEYNVESFIEEVQKLGLITNKTVILGPTYTGSLNHG